MACPWTWRCWATVMDVVGLYYFSSPDYFIVYVGKMICVGSAEVEPGAILSKGGVQGTWDESSEFVILTDELLEVMDSLERAAEDNDANDPDDQHNSDSD